MGGSLSTPERLYKVVKANNVHELQNMLQQMQRHGHMEAHTRIQYLEYKDPEGRTPLLLAAQKNCYHIAGMLLLHGADMTYMRKMQNGGTALHEAAANNHEALLELLLSHGAQAYGHPFLENYAGRTPMDLAVASGHVNIVRRLEKCALFCGYVALKVPGTFPFGKSWKTRWCVVMKRHPGPASETRQQDLVLWCYRDTASCAPVLRVSLTASLQNVAEQGPPEFALVLRAGHPKPADAALTRQGERHVLHFRPITAPNNAPINPNAPHAPNTLPEDMFFNFVRACAGYPASGPGPEQQAAPAAAAAPVAAAAAIPPPPPHNGADEMQAMPGETDEQFAARVALADTAEGSTATPTMTPAGSMTLGASMTPAGSQPLEQYGWGEGSSTNDDWGGQSLASQRPAVPAPGTPAQAPGHPSTGNSPQQAARPSSPSLPQKVTSAIGSIIMTTVPAMMSTVGGAVSQVLGQSGGSFQPGPSPQSGPSPPNRPQPGPSPQAGPSPAYAPPSQPPPQYGPQAGPAAPYGQGPSANPQPPLYHMPQMPMTQAQPTPRPPPTHTTPSGLLPYPSLDSLTSAPTLARLPSLGLPSAPALPDPFAPTTAPPPASYPLASAPSGSTLASAPSATSAVSASANEDDGLCVICLTNGREAGFLHGSTVHRCVCNECAVHIKVGHACPMCRQPVERVLGVY